MGMRKSKNVKGLFTSLVANGALLLNAGCAHHQWKGTDDREPMPPTTSLELDHTDHPFEDDIVSTPASQTITDHRVFKIDDFLHAKDTFHVEKLTYTSSNGQEGTSYLTVPEGDGPHPVVMVFPVLAEKRVISELMSKQLAREGYAVMRMATHPLEFVNTDDPNVTMDAYRSAILDARMLIDWMQDARPELDGSKIAAAGISLGSLLSSTLMGVEEDVKAGAFILVGGGLAEIFHDSTNADIEAFRAKVQAKQALDTREEFIAYMDEITHPYDPLTHAGNIDPCRVVMVTGRGDTEIPPETSENLWEAMGEPDWHTIPTQHKKHVAWFFYWIMGQVSDHFDDVMLNDRCAKKLTHTAPPILH